MGLLQWLRMTRGNMSVLSMITGMENNPSQLDLDARKHIAYCDSAESKHVDGQAHWAWAVKAGLRDHPGGDT